MKETTEEELTLCVLKERISPEGYNQLVNLIKQERNKATDKDRLNTDEKRKHRAQKGRR